MASLIVSVVPAHLLPVLQAVVVAATVANTRTISSVLAISAGISMHALPAMASHISLPVSSKAFPTVFASSAPVLAMISTSAPIASTYMPASLASAMVRQSSSEPATINHRPSPPDPVACNTLSRGPVIDNLHNRLARRDTKFAKLDEAFTARKNRVLFLN